MTRGWKSELGFQQILRVGLMRNLVRARVESSLAPFGCELGGLPTRTKNFAGTAIHRRLTWPLPGPPQIQNPNGPFGFRILDFGFWGKFRFCIRLLLLHADSGRRIQQSHGYVNYGCVINLTVQQCEQQAGTTWNSTW